MESNPSALNDENGIHLRLSAQRALWGQVPNTLRATSVEYGLNVIRCRFIFDGEPSIDEKDILGDAAAEIIADFPSPFIIEEEYIGIKYPERMSHLKYLVFLRYEP